MIRKETKVIKVGNVLIGGNNPIVIQSMCNIKTSHTKDVIDQILKLEKAGCQLIRVSILDDDDINAIPIIKQNIHIPLVADIHFDYKLAIKAIDAGADKIRINPGNIQNEDHLKEIIQKAKEKNIPIRIGVNSGSLDQTILKKYHNKVTVNGMCESVLKFIKFFEDNGFYDLVLSVKTTNIKDTIKVNEKLSKLSSYPLHIGLTEAGTVMAGSIKSSYVLGTLLEKGIGDTIRVSLNGDPLYEVKACKEILAMHGLYNKPTLIACPGCGRTNYNMEPIVREIDEFLDSINSNIKVAIMGCAVNGPGEARQADIGIAGGCHEALLFKKGKIVKKIPEDEITSCLKEEILKLTKNNL